MDVLKKKQLLEEMLDSKGRGSRAELARFCGVRERVVSDWLNPKGGWPPATRTAKICAFFGCAPNSFSEDKGTTLPQVLSSGVAADEASQFRRELIRAKALITDLTRRASRLSSELPDSYGVGQEPIGEMTSGSLRKTFYLTPYSDLLAWVKALHEQVLPGVEEASRPRAESIFKRLSTLLDEGVTSYQTGEHAVTSDKEKIGEILWLEDAMSAFRTGIKELADIPGMRGVHALREVPNRLHRQLHQLTHTGKWPTPT